jgi:hypothetical protein
MARFLSHPSVNWFALAPPPCAGVAPPILALGGLDVTTCDAGNRGVGSTTMAKPHLRKRFMNQTANGLHRIVVVGGGAGGLELVTRLGRLGKRGKAHVTLIEKARTHFWKPHLHEIAAGSIDINNHAIDYPAQSHWHGFRYRLER